MNKNCLYDSLFYLNIKLCAYFFNNKITVNYVYTAWVLINLEFTHKMTRDYWIIKIIYFFIKIFILFIKL